MSYRMARPSGKSVRLYAFRGITSRDPHGYPMVSHPLAVYSCFSWPDHRLVGGVNANSIHACDYCNQTPSLTTQEFTCVIFSIQACGQSGTVSSANFLFH
jgi:hypothetical protein